ncbi:MAG: sensor histidine kinase, partial [Rhodospirillales bacterium]|nr:sensor histidine kinase [Rhodospirillales bacterium]
MSTKPLNSLKGRFLLLLVPLLVALGAVFFVAFDIVIRDVVNALGRSAAEKQVLNDRARSLVPIVKEITLAERLSQSPAMLVWARDEADSKLKQQGLAVLESYRKAFRDGSYFFVIDKSGNYYFNDRANKYAGKQLRYTLKPDNPKDGWYYSTKAKGGNCTLNVDFDPELKVTKLWINCLLKDETGVAGIIGTGLDLSSFINSVVKANEPGVANMFIDQDGAIQAHPNIDAIDFHTVTKKADAKKTIFSLIGSEIERQNLKDQMVALAKSPGAVSTLFMNIEGQTQLVGLAYVKEIGWYNVTVMDLEQIILSSHFLPLALLVLVSIIITVVLIGGLLNRVVLVPIAKLDMSVQAMREGDYQIDIKVDSNDEIGRLATNFTNMAGNVNSAIERISTAHKAAQAANMSKSEFLANMSHELRTPLNAIIGFSEALSSGALNVELPELAQSYVNDINSSGHHLLELINDILDMSAIESGKMTLHQAPVHLMQLVSFGKEIVVPVATKKDISITSEVPIDFPVINVDERRMRQVVINLLTNAVKYSNPGSHVTITAKNIGDNIALGFRDNGIGMTDEELKIALTPFGRVESSYSAHEDGGGTGLGLPLCQSLAEAHGGSMIVESVK